MVGPLDFRDMKLAKVKSVVLDKALESRQFSSLHMYIAGFAGFERTSDGCFVSEIVDDCGTPTLELKLALSDYFFNEGHEANKLWDFAEKTIGKKIVDIKVVNIVQL